jgi:hypothetical protein
VTENHQVEKGGLITEKEFLKNKTKSKNLLLFNHARSRELKLFE